MSRGKKLTRIFTELDRNFDINVGRLASGRNYGINIRWLHVKHTVQCGILGTNSAFAPELGKTMENLDQVRVHLNNI
jgi:hypothetical protein